jgi:hypothetical protein
MSHLSILPTVLQDETLLALALEDLGLSPEPAQVLRGFGADRQPVSLRVQLAEGLQIGWSRQSDGSLALVGDLQRLARSTSVQQLIGQITRCYAARHALQSAARELPGARVALVS